MFSLKEEIAKLYKNEIGLKTKFLLRDSIETALRVHEEFVNEKKEYFDCPNRISLIGRMRTFAVERQVFNDSFKEGAPYNAYFQEVNNFHQLVLNIETDHFLFNIIRTKKYNQMPAASKYKRKNARGNNEIEGQFNLGLEEQENTEGKKYALVTYGIDMENKMSHIGILLPDAELKNFYGYDDLKELPNVIDGIKINQESKEESLVKLRNEMNKEIAKII